MRKIILLFLFQVILALIAGCDSAETIFKTVEKEKLSPPLGLRSVTQDGKVTLFWYTSNYEDDFGGYFVFQAVGDYTSLSSDSSLNESIFSKVDSVQFSGPSDGIVSAVIRGLTNGTTYSFCVVSYNKKDKSKISYPSNIVKETPRPEVQTITITSASTGDVTGDDSRAGFDFHELRVVGVPAVLGNYTTTDGIVDIVNEAFDPSAANTNIRPWLAGMNGAGIQDLGYMGSLDEADIAPGEGYSKTGESIAVLLGHVYAVKTGDGRYGKLIVTQIGNDYSITFNAAFQTVAGDRNYKSTDLLWRIGVH